MPSIVWRGQLTFGLVSIPVKLFRAARRERIRMHYVHRTEPEESQESMPAEKLAPLSRSARSEAAPPEIEAVEIAASPAVSRLRQSLITQDAEVPVRAEDVLRGYEVEPERYVTFDREELKKLQRRTSASMEIVRSVRLAEIDPVFFDVSYYVVPDSGGERPYALLFEALKETGHVALARVGMYGREHVVIIRPGEHGMLAHTMFYTDEIRSENEFRVDLRAAGKELELAKAFLEAIEAPFAPEEFKDEYRNELQALIEKEKSHGAGMPAVQSARTVEPVVDILEALKKSIAIARKPPVKETAPIASKEKRQTRKAR